MSWQHLRDTMPVACKEHQCYLCDGPIRAGERHVSRVGMANGDLLSMRMHTACEALTHDWDETDWESFDAAEFRYYLEETRAQEA